jgi:hypothetical protein
MRDGPTIRRKLRCCLLWQTSSCQWYGLDLFLEREGRGWITINKRHLHEGGCAGSVKCRGGSPSASVPPTHRTSTTAPPSTGTSIKNTCSWNVDEPYGITLCETANFNPKLSCSYTTSEALSSSRYTYLDFTDLNQECLRAIHYPTCPL